MKKHYFLGLAANYSRDERKTHLFKVGKKEDLRDLEAYLVRRYGGIQSVLTKNGRSALALALKAYFDKGDEIIVNGFTCYAVFEAIKAAELKPIFADISKANLNFDIDALEKSLSEKAKGIIIQNTLGNPIDIKAVERLAKKYNLTIIEDLAHCAGAKYADGRETGTVGAAVALSFGKEKSIDTVSGGAVVFQQKPKKADPPLTSRLKAPRFSDHLRARLYPSFGALCRTLSYAHLGGPLMRLFLRIHWVERSADNRLDLTRRCSKFEAKLALMQLKALRRRNVKPIREFYFVDNRRETLKELKDAGYYFDSFWYEKPVSPERYYKKAHFPEKDCPNAVWITKHIVNLPTYYKKKDLTKARNIIDKHKIEVEKHEK